MADHHRPERRPDHFRRRGHWRVLTVLGGLRRGLSAQGRWQGAGARLTGALIVALLLSPGLARAEPTWHSPVKVVADSRLTVTTQAGTTQAGSGDVPLYLSADGRAADWSH